VDVYFLYNVDECFLLYGRKKCKIFNVYQDSSLIKKLIEYDIHALNSKSYKKSVGML
jgi:hypothetical protein